MLSAIWSVAYASARILPRMMPRPMTMPIPFMVLPKPVTILPVMSPSGIMDHEGGGDRREEQGEERVQLELEDREEQDGDGDDEDHESIGPETIESPSSTVPRKVDFRFVPCPFRRFFLIASATPPFRRSVSSVSIRRGVGAYRFLLATASPGPVDPFHRFRPHFQDHGHVKHVDDRPAGGCGRRGRRTGNCVSLEELRRTTSAWSVRLDPR